MDRERFLEQYPGYNDTIQDFRQDQIPSFGSPDAAIYLDYAGSAPFTKFQVDAQSKSLLDSQWANPHSQGPIGMAVLDRIQATRRRILQFVNVSPATHEVIFCAGATAAIRLVADSFAWSPSSTFAFMQLNHNSVVGVREVARALGASVVCLDENYEIVSEIGERTDEDLSSCSLLAVPAECNFSGIRPSLSMLSTIRDVGGVLSGFDRKWAVLLDASKYCATTKLDLGEIAADFTVVSFYKIFGLPTGLGALIIRIDAEHLLSRKTYFGGGTYDALIATELFYQPRTDLASRFEDGSIAFTLIDSINSGFDLIEGQLGGLRSISEHCSSLTAFVASEMLRMEHYNGAPVFKIYGYHHDGEMPPNQGSIITFSALTESGSYRGYSHIHRLASACGFQLRSGCFCNSGACQKFLQLSPDDIRKHLERGHVCGDDIDMIDGKPTGCLRISFGYASTYSDAAAWVDFARRYLVKQDVKLQIGLGLESNADYMTISSLTVFPIKSCTGFRPTEWPISRSGGLAFDRHWALVDDRNRLISQIKVPRLAEIQARICRTTNRLIVVSKSSNESYIVSLEADNYTDNVINISDCSRIRKAELYECSRHWFSTAIGINCCLIRFLEEDCGNVLVTSSSSLAALSSNGDISWDMFAFRANIIFDGGKPFSEERWKGFVSDDDLHFEMVHRCLRCTMIGKLQFSELNRLRANSEFGVIFRYLPSATRDKRLLKLLRINTKISGF